MYELKEATCDCCRTVFRAISKRHYCAHCDKYYYVCSRCNQDQPVCPSCGIALRKKSAPLSMMKEELGIAESLRIHNLRKQRYFGNQ